MDNSTPGLIVCAIGVLMLFAGFIVFSSSANTSIQALNEMPLVPIRILGKFVNNLRRAMKGQDLGMILILGGAVVIVIGAWIYYTN